MVTGVAGAILLFALRRLAFTAFVAHASSITAAALWGAITNEWLLVAGPAAFVSWVLGYVLTLAVCVYTWHLRQRGVLR
jgi:hypothetical protein